MLVTLLASKCGDRRFSRLQSLHSHGAWRIQIDSEFFRDVGNGQLGFHAVAGFIERWRKYRNRTLAGNYGDNAAAYAALCRQPNVPGPAAGTVIETGHRHGG